MRIILIVSVCLLFLSVGAFSKPVPVNYEYKLDLKCSEKHLNDLAADGWEFAGISESSYGALSRQTCVFKRSR